MNPKKLRCSTQKLHLMLGVAFLAALATLGMAAEDAQRPIDGIMDNSIFVEEAYNQEPGIVQHIFTGGYSIGRLSRPGGKTLDLLFTQEWPAYGQTHQLSYSVPYTFAREGADWSDGFGDVLLN